MKRQRVLIALLLQLLQSCSQNTSAQPASQPAKNDSTRLVPQNASQVPAAAPQLSAAAPSSSPHTELDILTQLGWKQAYNPQGYSINTSLLGNCSHDTWQSLSLLKSLTNLTLTGILPDLPDSWASNGSLPSLQALDLSHAQLNGSLPASWGSPDSFQKLRSLNLTNNLSGTLPASWGNDGSFPALIELQLGATEAGISRLSGTLPPEWGSSAAFPALRTLCINYSNVSGIVTSMSTPELALLHSSIL